MRKKIGEKKWEEQFTLCEVQTKWIFLLCKCNKQTKLEHTVRTRAKERKIKRCVREWEQVWEIERELELMSWVREKEKWKKWNNGLWIIII